MWLNMWLKMWLKMAKDVAKDEVPLVEIPPEFFTIDQQQGLAALAYPLRRHIENAGQMPLISILGSTKTKTVVRINRGLANDNQIPAFPFDRDGSGGKKLKPPARR
jgi:hypothetical protein